MKAELFVAQGASAGIRQEIEDEVIVGRDAGCDLQIFDSSVSRRHFRVSRDGRIFWLEDLGSKSGTRLNGERTQKSMLYHDDLISCGRSVVRFDCPRVRRPDDTAVLLRAPSLDLPLDQLEPDPAIDEANRSNIDEMLAASEDSTELRRLTELLRVSAEISRQRTVDEVLDVLCDQLETAIGHRRLILFRVGEDGPQQWRVRKAIDDPKGAKLPVDRELIERTIGRNRPQAITGKMSCELVAPLRGVDATHGALYVEIPARPDYMRTLEGLDHLCREVGAAIERCQLEGQIKHHNMQMLEVTQRLRDSETRYRHIVEQSVVGIYRTTPEGRILLANRAFLEMLGFDSIEEMSRWNMEHESLFAGYDREAFKQAFEKDGMIRGREVEWRRRDGSIGILRENAVAIRGEDGSIQYYQGTVEDITAHIRAREDYRRLFESAHDAILIFDADSEQVLEANQRACEVYGRERDQLIGMSLREVTRDVAAGRARVEQVMSTTEPVQFDSVQYRSDGTEMHLEVNASLVEYQGRAAILSINRDVTRRKALERDFLQAQKMEAMGRLAGGVAHDFNNILTAILGYAQLCQMRASDTAPALVDHLREIVRAADRGSALTRQLLTFSRKDVIAPRVIDLNAVVSGMEKMVSRLLEGDIELRMDLGLDLPPVEADQNQLEQVLMNLLVNARDAMPEGGTISLATFETTLREEDREDLPAGRYCCLLVSDTGVGMDEATRARVFEPFFTTKVEGQGTGLGLSTVYGIIMQNRGAIDIDSAPGRGTVFTITLPVSGATDGPAVRERTDRGLARGSETVLVVEDDPAVRELTCHALGAAGYRVLEASNGEEAQQLAGAHSTLDLLLTDVMLPGVKGPELHAELLTTRADLPVLFISGYVGHERGDELVRGRPFLPKPFTPEHLTRTVREVLDAR